jgi:hypothetical protein
VRSCKLDARLPEAGVTVGELVTGGGIQSQLFEKWLYGHLVSKIFGGKMKMMGLENFGKNRLIIWCPTGRRRTIDGSKLAPVGKISGLRLCV